MAVVGKCTRKQQDGNECGRTTLDTRGNYLALDGTSRWILLCEQCRHNLEDVLEQFTVNAVATPWLTAAPIVAPDETVWTVPEVRRALAQYLGEAGRTKTGFLSRWELGIFRGLFRGIAEDIDTHASPAVIEMLREEMARNRAK